VQDALAAPLRDPLQALTEIVSARATRVHPYTDHNILNHTDGNLLDASTAQLILSRRHFRMLTPMTILKSAYLPCGQLQPTVGNSCALEPSLPSIEGAHDLRRMTQRPVWFVSNPTVQVWSASYACQS
jgi:hypothetical protein